MSLTTAYALPAYFTRYPAARGFALGGDHVAYAMNYDARSQLDAATAAATDAAVLSRLVPELWYHDPRGWYTQARTTCSPRSTC